MFFDTDGTGGERRLSRRVPGRRLIGVYQYYGFEACGDVAEEVPDPSRGSRRACGCTIYVGGAASILRLPLGASETVPDVPSAGGGRHGCS